ncbi:MAG TPA: hypothetical protein VD905_19055, partial [Flavobacteriales bacterium]|nr:hypothetical protein [Flavobacteriales bacterium]
MSKLYKALFILALGTPLTSTAQVFWTEDFDAVACPSDCILPYAGVNGNWTGIATGFCGPERNDWYYSCAENGNAAGVCGSGCGSDNSLHISSN